MPKATRTPTTPAATAKRLSAVRKRGSPASTAISATTLRASSEPREMELIGCDQDGNMFLWDTGMVQPVSKFELINEGFYIRSGHYVIEWKGHAIVVHCGNYADGWISVQFMCSGGVVVRMHRLEVEEMLIGKVIPDPEIEAQLSRTLDRLIEASKAEQAAPHRQRGRI